MKATDERDISMDFLAHTVIVLERYCTSRFKHLINLPISKTLAGRVYQKQIRPNNLIYVQEIPR